MMKRLTSLPLLAISLSLSAALVCRFPNLPKGDYPMSIRGRVKLSEDLSLLMREFEAWIDEAHVIIALKEDNQTHIVSQGRLLYNNYKYWLVRHLNIWDSARDEKIEWCE